MHVYMEQVFILHIITPVLYHPAENSKPSTRHYRMHYLSPAPHGHVQRFVYKQKHRL